ncbi:unnamed protein product [Calypogeia fissa]
MERRTGKTRGKILVETSKGMGETAIRDQTRESGTRDEVSDMHLGGGMYMQLFGRGRGVGEHGDWQHTAGTGQQPP